MKKIQKYWYLFWKFRALRLMQMLEYRTNFFFWAVVSIMWTIFNFFFFGLLLQARGEIAGWNTEQIYVLLGTYTMLDAFTWSFFYHNMSEYTNSIFSGQMTLTLTRPINPQYLISIQGNSYTNVPRFFIGLFVLIKTIRDAQIPITLSGVLSYIAIFCVSLLFIYSLWFLVATCTFWVDKLDNVNELVPATRRVWQVPKEVYTGFFSTIFTVILPLSLIASLPSEFLLGKDVGLWVWFYLVFTVCLFWLSNVFFKYSVKKYVGVAN